MWDGTATLPVDAKRDGGANLHREGVLVVVLTLLAFAHYAAYAASFAFDLGDEGYLYYLGERIARGARPYHDFSFVSYLPGAFWLDAWVDTLVGPSIHAHRLAQASMLAAVPGLLYLAYRRFASRGAAWAVAATVLLVPGPWTKSYVALLWAGLLWTALRVDERPTASRVVCLGGVVGLSFGLRIDVAIIGLVLIGVLWWRGRLDARSSARVGLGAALGFLPFGVFLAQREALSGYLGQLLGFPVAIVERLLFTDRLAPPAPASLVFAGDNVLRSWLFYAALAWIAVFTIHVLRKRHWASRPGWAIALVWILGQVPQFAVERPDIAHLTEHLAAIGLAILVVVGLPSRPGPRRATHAAATAYLLLFVVHCIDSGEGGARRFPAREVVWTSLSNGRSFPMRPERASDALVEAILSSTAPDEPVANWPFAPGVNFLADRRMPGHRIFVTPETTDAAVEQELIDDLEREGVDLVVYASGFGMHGDPSSLPPNFMTRVDAHLEARFRTQAVYDGFELRRRVKSIDSTSR